MTSTHTPADGRTYLDVGRENALSGLQLAVYVAFMSERWPETEAQKCDTRDGYAAEWARRFARGMEWQCSDHLGRGILQRLSECYPADIQGGFINE